MGAPEELIRGILAEIVEYARRRLQSDRYAPTLAQLGHPDGLVLPDFFPDLALPLLELTLVVLGDAAEMTLDERRAEIVRNLGEIVIWAALDLLIYLKTIAPPPTEG
jgi:hypothetical protein